MTSAVQSEDLLEDAARPERPSAARVEPSRGPVYLRADRFEALDHLLFEADEVRVYADLARERVEWVAATASLHIEHCAPYARLAKAQRFDPDELRRTGDLASVPLVTSSMFKKRKLHGPLEGEVLECTSSGTLGSKSVVCRDRPTMERFVGTVLYGYRHLYEQNENRRGFALSPETNQATDLWFAYVLGLFDLAFDTSFYVENGAFEPARLYEDLASLDAGVQPFIAGPPPLVRDFVRWIAAQKHTLDLGRRDALIVTAGGWKSRQAEAITRDKLTAEIEQVLGVQPSSVRDCFNMVELNTVIMECEQRAKHVPPWLTVIARRAEDMRPAPAGEVGLLSYLDPTARSFPCFVLSDDWGTVEDVACPCGRTGPTLRIDRRVSSVEERGCALKMERYGQRGSTP